MTSFPLQLPADDEDDEWETAFHFDDPLDVLELDDDSEPEPEYGDFWFEEDDPKDC